ncbi:MAG: four helix bundle protein [Alphaproteobacteria bacterium]|nr:four helix bundle protein [Alphaproteobacteria bacterium]
MKFSIRIYNLVKYLIDEKKEFVLSKQILKSGTSIGANLAEAKCAISDAEHLAKLYISYKECSETLYWLDLLNNINLITEPQFKSIYKDCEEIIKILTSAIKKSKTKVSVKKNETK